MVVVYIRRVAVCRAVECLLARVPLRVEMGCEVSSFGTADLGVGCLRVDAEFRAVGGVVLRVDAERLREFRARYGVLRVGVIGRLDRCARGGGGEHTLLEWRDLNGSFLKAQRAPIDIFYRHTRLGYIAARCV